MTDQNKQGAIVADKRAFNIEITYGFVRLSQRMFLDEDGNTQYMEVTNNNGVITENQIIRMIYK